MEVESIAYEGITVYHRNDPVLFDARSLGALMTSDFSVTIGVGTGSGEADVITTDLTPEYVRFNGDPS